MRRHWFGRGLLVMGIVGVTLLLVVSPVTGVETGYPSDCTSTTHQAAPMPGGAQTQKLVQGSWGNFSGAIRGNFDGVWSADVCHTQLSTHQSARVLPGGRFGLKGASWGARDGTTGTFVTGEISVGNENDIQIGGRGFCRQTYEMRDVTTTSGLIFNATLTHYGSFYDGYCHIFFALFQGNWTTGPKHSIG